MSSAKIAPFQMPEGGDDAPADLRRYKRPVEPAFVTRGADGKRRAAATDEEWAEEARYRRELCFFELTDQSPRMYLDPALPLGAAAFNHLAWQCVFSKKPVWAAFAFGSSDSSGAWPERAPPTQVLTSFGF